MGGTIGNTLATSAENVTLNANGSADFSGRVKLTGRGGDSTLGGNLIVNRGSTPTNDQEIGILSFAATNTSAAQIYGTAGNNWASNELSGELRFATRPQTGGASITDRMLIDKDGNVEVGGTLGTSPNITLDSTGVIRSKGNFELDSTGTFGSSSKASISAQDGSAQFAGGDGATSNQSLGITANGSEHAAGHSN